MVNKINSMGLSKVKYAVINTAGTTSTFPTYGTFKTIPGVVEMTLEPQTSETSFYADNIAQFTENAFTQLTGTFTFGVLPDSFYTEVLGWKATTNGSLFEATNAQIKEILITGEVATNDKAVRFQMFKVKVSPHSESIKTKGEEAEAQPVTFDFTTLPLLNGSATRIKMLEPASTDLKTIRDEWAKYQTAFVSPTTS